MLRALFGAILGGVAGWSMVMIVPAYGLATISSGDVTFVHTIAIGCGAVAGSILGATSAVTDVLRAGATATHDDIPQGQT